MMHHGVEWSWGVLHFQTNRRAWLLAFDRWFCHWNSNSWTSWTQFDSLCNRIKLETLQPVRIYESMKLPNPPAGLHTHMTFGWFNSSQIQTPINTPKPNGQLSSMYPWMYHESLSIYLLLIHHRFFMTNLLVSYLMRHSSHTSGSLEASLTP